ncbi:MAG: PH domain-containing protein [Candidatus Omnitrophica bacterium]|nr:PH domain-containing protein [Candidatus Omnitrophota bacterium]
MSYEKIWKKILGTDEKVKFEFSVGDYYIKLGLIFWAIIGLPFLIIFFENPSFISGLSVFPFLMALFYYGFYLKKANAYAFTNKRVLIHRGWLSTKTTSVDYSKITEVKVREPFFSKIITRTGQIAINTATGRTNFQTIILNHVEAPYEIKKKLDSLKS